MSLGSQTRADGVEKVSGTECCKDGQRLFLWSEVSPRSRRTWPHVVFHHLNCPHSCERSNSDYLALAAVKQRWRLCWIEWRSGEAGWRSAWRLITPAALGRMCASSSYTCRKDVTDIRIAGWSCYTFTDGFSLSGKSINRPLRGRHSDA